MTYRTVASQLLITLVVAGCSVLPGGARTDEGGTLVERARTETPPAAALERLEFLAGEWRIRDADGHAQYRWHPGTLWLTYAVAIGSPGGGSYEVAGGVSYDAREGKYVAYAINNVAPRVLEYRGHWVDESTLVFEGVAKASGKRQRVQYRRQPDGAVVFSASEATGQDAYRTYFEAVLVRVVASKRGDSDEAHARDPDAILDDFATRILAADYRGDRAELDRLAAALDQVREPALSAYRRYWQGFARWRRALNGFNLNPTPADLKADLQAAVRSFQSALVDRPGWVEAEIGITGCAGNLLFLAGGNQGEVERILDAHLPVMRAVAAKADSNSRALWLAGGTALGAPPPYGGDPVKAESIFQRGLAAARREALTSASLPARVPTWGGPENLMSLAYLHSHSSLEDRDLAFAYARAALVAVPAWHYVSEVLIPQIEALAPRPRCQAAATCP